jgi:hypothetical protein
VSLRVHGHRVYIVVRRLFQKLAQGPDMVYIVLAILAFGRVAAKATVTVSRSG